MFKFILVLLAVALQAALAQQDYCSQFQVNPCQLRVDRDIMFLIDGSNSMSQDRFYGEVLDYTLALYCSFPQDLKNKAGMVLFNQRVEVIIPLQAYTRTQWHSKVLEVRDSRNSSNPACCSCCTPTGDALRVANEEFNRRASNPVQLTFVITDGLPSNNNMDTGGYPEWWYHSTTEGYDPSLYNTVAVPSAAHELKNAGRRVILVGVPNALMVAPDQKYFSAGYANNYNYCVTRQSVNFCTKYYTVPQANQSQPNFPIVSLPVNKNSFSITTWNDQNMLNNIVDALCYVEPTKTPTRLPTSQSPTSKQPTRLPTSPQPTNQPTSQAPTQSPVRPSLQQVDLTFIVDRSNSMNYVPQLCQQVLDTFPAATTGKVSSSPCWQLWTQFITNQARDFTKIAAGEQGEREMGWASDFAETTVPAKGLRVNVIGFACTNKQRTPKIFQYSQDMFGGPISSQQDFNKLIEYMRTEVLPTGGTCPHLAIEQAVKYVENKNAEKYPLQSVILMTDGVTYDGTATPRATQGLFAYKVLTYAVGISVVQGSSQTYGMTKQEIETQRKQLSAFVRDDPKYFYNLEEGWSGLLDVAKTIADSLPSYYFNNANGKPLARYTWCGFRRQHNCASDSNRQGHCKWKGTSNQEYKCGRV